MEFKVHREKLLEDLAPVGPVETTLAERIVRLFWRLQHAEQLQNEALNRMIAREASNPLTKLAESLLAEDVDLMGDHPEVDPNLVVGRAVVKDFAGEAILERLSIYEEKVEDKLFEAMHELERLQDARKRGTGKQPPASE